MRFSTGKVAAQAWFKNSRVRGRVVRVYRAMQSISLRSTEPVICLAHLVPFLKEFTKFFKTAKDRVVI